MISNEQIARAWKDTSYRSTLSDAQRAQLPSHPAGLVEFDENQRLEGRNAMMSSFWWQCNLTFDLCSVFCHSSNPWSC
jgi:mersacidin/lichenicidin family type 2 lantibiotic